MEILFLRHGKTQANLEYRYSGGGTDDPLCPEGIEALKPLDTFFPAEKIYESPMKRTLMTAELCFPGCSPVITEGFREMDFGEFEGKNAKELENDGHYKEWVDSNCTLPCPKGESIGSFSERVCVAFEEVISHANENRIAIVTHGGTIMAILSRFAEEKREYFEWLAKNGGGYIAFADTSGDELILKNIRAFGKDDV